MDSGIPVSDSDRDKNRDGPRQISDDSATDIPFVFPPDAQVFLRDPLARQDVRETIYEVHRGLCFWTRSPLDKDDFSLDHVLPVARGGPDNLFNLVPTSSHLNSVRGSSFEAEAVIACLSIIRMSYGPRAYSLLRKKRLAAGEPAGNWWCVEREWIRRPRLIPYSGRPNSLIADLERFRINIADLVRTRDGDWLVAIGNWLVAREIRRAILPDIKRGWCSVVTAIRSE